MIFQPRVGKMPYPEGGAHLSLSATIELLERELLVKSPRLLHPTEAQDQKPQTILLLSNYRGEEKKKTINKRAFCVAQTWIYTQL